ncbi:Nucleoporin NUP145 [Paramyrothecium foliicola]|nr:Nucleoporin NUP145 [Paramyrothecium foliicola]
MSFGGGGFGGFGQNNNNQSTTFGFGQNNNNTPTTGFGGASNTGGFGQSNTGGTGMFGNTTNTTTPAFGASGGFGASNTTSAFGAKPAFGAGSTGGTGLFGASANTSTPSTTTGFGGFGAANNNNTTASPFGGGATTGGGMFGSTAAKPAFGATGTTGGLFGGNTGTTTTGTTGFGSGGFGATNNPGLGGGAGDPPGTGISPFQAFTEKEANSTSTNSFQNVLFQEPYKKWSAEELRLVDYAQGRRHGNASGAGAFGVSSGFGSGFGTSTQTGTGFGGTTTSTGGGLFGANNTTTTNNTPSTGFGAGGFGANNTTNTATTGGGLFGAKPAGTGLFGGGTQTQSTGGAFGASSGTGFGAAANTGTGFGQTSNTGTGLFGNTAQKPATGGFSFGNTNAQQTPAFGGGTSTGGFGTNTQTGTSGGLFGNSSNQPSGGLFGNTQQQQQGTTSGFGGFGQQNQPQQTGGGLFGNAQQKPAGTGLFGGASTTTPATGGLFGNTNNQQQTTSAFGGNSSTGTGLFGGAKPATGGLFGGQTNTAQNTGTGGGLFGGLGNNQQNQQSTGTGLFGGANTQQQKPGGLFGSSTQSTGGLFGGQNNQSQGLSFGNSTNQQQNTGFGSSLLGNSQQSNNAPQGLTANLNDVSAYGSPSLFAGVGGNETPNPGPLATPVNGSGKPRRGSVLPLYRLAPSTSSRFATPQKRGFGFSYSSYGTPGGSPASSISSTPGTLGRSLLGSSTGGSLSKSVSASNLRRSYNTEDSILAPGAFSASSASRLYGSTGSKKLVINREIRSDLFSTPQKDKTSVDTNTGSRKLTKRVSFDTGHTDVDEGTPVRALPAPTDTPGSQGDETPRQSKTSNGPNGLQTTEAEATKSKPKELHSVPEEGQASTPEPRTIDGFDNAPGHYWMRPSHEEIQAMNRVQRQKVDSFTVGRDNVGSITFKVPVDLSNIDIDDICGGIIELVTRSATVYPISAKKPPVGKGLNVPARISLEHSWPRNSRDKRITSDPKRLAKHVDRLKQIPDTTFEDYDKDTGIWTFSVEHFTTYGLDDSDSDSDDGDVEMDQPTATPRHADPQEVISNASSNSPMEDDTFDFKQRRGLPGGFDDPEDVYETAAVNSQSFLGISSADSAPNDVHLSLEVEAGDMGAEYELSDDEDMATSPVGQHLAAEHEELSPEDEQEAKRGTPGGVLRARMRAMKDSVGPVRLEVADGDDWMEMLRKTVSPVKRDRQLLRELNDSPSRQTGKLIDFDNDEANENFRSSTWKRSTMKDRIEGLATNKQLGRDTSRGFATSIDLMNSLFEKPRPAVPSLPTPVSKGFPKFPYERQEKTPSINESDRAFHEAGRPSWGPNELLVFPKLSDRARQRRIARDVGDIISFQKSSIQTSKQELRMARLSPESSKKFLRTQDQLTEIRLVDGVPVATLRANNLKELFHGQDINNPASIHEKQVWELASILFDNISATGLPEADRALRRAKLSQFWTELVEQASNTTIGLAASSEEKAVACLAGHRVADACKYLLEGKNFRLGTLVALIGADDAAKKEMKEQIRAWHDSKVLSEFSEAIRTMYELLSGNVCVCEGIKGVPTEDRLESFVISKKFGLDWKQAFGLRLWYAISKNEDLSAAVSKFKHDIDQDKEDLPRPWYAENGIKPLWDDKHVNTRQDLLWGLLQLYSNQGIDLGTVLEPENSQLSPLDMRLSWQLGLALQSTGRVSYGPDGPGKADAATLAYTTQLTSAGEWIEAVFVLLHLNDPIVRTKAIQDHLCRHAALIGPESGSTFSILTEKFRIPSQWVWQALALYMRSVKKEPSSEVQCLLRAELFVEAHRVLVQQVAPLAIIERDYASLSTLLSQFQGRQDAINDWSLGGEIYGHFLTLVQHRTKSEAVSPAVLERLLTGLQAMNENAGDKDVTRYAAISDMADETAKEIISLSKKKQDHELRSRILALPLTQDRLLSYSVDLGLNRFRELQALRTKPEAAAGVPTAPASATLTPSPNVRIQKIQDPGHPAHGQHGLFAAQHLRPGTLIVAYLGRVHGGSAAGTAPDSDYDLWLDRGADVAVDAAREGNEARFVNDYRGVRDRANAEFANVWCERWGELCVGIWVLGQGKKDKSPGGIRKGDEILVSYGKGFWDERKAD